MSDLTFPEWQGEYLEALVELDLAKLSERISGAENTLLARLHVLTDISEIEAEKQAISDALDALYVLKRDKLDFPDWRRKQQ